MLHSMLVRNLFFPLSLARNGELAQLRYLREFEKSQWLSADELRDLQWRRLRALLAHADANCPFYAERFATAGVHPESLRGPEDLPALPILEKSDIQSHGHDMVARNWPGDDRIPNQTGGSTGTPIRFVLSRDRKCSRAAATWRHNRWAGWDIGDSSAVLWGAPTDRPAENLRTRMRRWMLAEPTWLDTGHLTEATMRGFADILHKQRPAAILAYARSAVLFARFLRDRGLEIPSPRSLVTSAETLDDADRALLEEVFGTRVFNRYGCREVSVVASECPAHDGFHVMAEGLIVEVVTPAGAMARPGEIGSVVVTDLLNHAMPLIRYRIGDLAAPMGGLCACGRSLPRLQGIAGRVTDFLVGSGDRLVSGVFLATYVVAQRPSLGQVQIRQHERGRIVYHLVPAADFDAVADVDYLRAATCRTLGDEMVTEVKLEKILPKEASGKFLFSRSSVTPAFLNPSARQEVTA